MTCSNCRFARSHAYRIPTPNAKVIQGTELRCHIRSVPGSFPSRKADDWCGEFEPNAAPEPTAKKPPSPEYTRE